jgi:hypothetical protein
MLTLDQIIAEFNIDDNTYFPRAALEDAIAQQDAITPVLLDIINNVANNPKSLEDSPAFIYCIYLLAQFREKRAYPIIVQYFGQLGCEDDALDLTGDIVTEDLNSILASVCNGDSSLIKQLIEDSGVNQYVRSAALNALVILYNTDQMSRAELINYIGTRLDYCLNHDEDPFFVAYLVILACDIHPKELYDVIVQCFDRELLEEDIIDRKYIDECMQMAIEKVLAKLKEHPLYQLINNVISEMEWWACFNPPPHSIPNLPVRHDSNAKLGRNDPCPCGSGKKYKKCCL